MSGRNKKFAIISVSDKKNIDKIANELVNNGYNILSTGGTAKFLTSKNVPNISISKFTKFDEILEGRVKTLHPIIHAGILAKDEKSLKSIKNTSYSLIDMVIVNLYPFEQVISKKNCKFSDAIENIDIGGPTMLRAAAKNHNRVTVLTDPNDYQAVIKEIKSKGCTTKDLRYKLALKAFSLVSKYDSAITNYLIENSKNKENLMPTELSIVLEKENNLRYGENPHQNAALYSIKTPKSLGFNFKQLAGKELSFNNLVDSESALSCVKQFKKHACVIVKHANPCGVSESTSLLQAYNEAYETDPTSAFGGIIAFNKKLDHKLLKKILSQQFIEVIVAPNITKECLSIMKTKPNVRLMVIEDFSQNTKTIEMKSLKSKFLIQESDVKVITRKDLKVVTKKNPLLRK